MHTRDGYIAHSFTASIKTRRPIMIRTEIKNVRNDSPPKNLLYDWRDSNRQPVGLICRHGWYSHEGCLSTVEFGTGSLHRPRDILSNDTFAGSILYNNVEQILHNKSSNKRYRYWGSHAAAEAVRSQTEFTTWRNFTLDRKTRFA